MDKYKEYVVVAVVSILCTFGVYTYILNNVKQRDAKEVAALQGQIQILERLSKEQADKNKVMQENIDKMTIVVADAHKNTTDALAVLNGLKKPVVIDDVETVEDVKSAIAEHYNDNAVMFDGQKFGVIKSTMFNLTDDAIEWKVNGPILTSRLQGTEAALSASQNENGAKDRLIGSQVNLISGLNNSIGLCNESSSNKDRIITLYERDLKIESMNGKIKFVIGAGIGAGTYYIIDRVRKK